MLAALFATACSSDKKDEPELGSKITNFIPNVQICKTNGDYSNYISTFTDNERKIICYLPSPERTGNPPRKLAQDFYLFGGDKNTVFLRWTLDEYRALPEIPDPKVMLSKIIPDARVTLCYELPFRIGEFGEDEDELCRKCNELIEAGLPGCKLIYKLEE